MAMVSIDLVVEFLALQKPLLKQLAAFLHITQFDRFLSNVPKVGKFELLGESWCFKKHGIGVTFESHRGVIVEVHNAMNDPEFFDAYRLSEYACSVNKPIRFEEAQLVLIEWLLLGRIEKAADSYGGEGYKLKTH